MKTYTTEEAIELLKQGKKIKLYCGEKSSRYGCIEPFTYGYFCLNADGHIINAYETVCYNDLNDFKYWRCMSEWIEFDEST